MSGRIPQQFIEDLLARTDIVDLIDAHVPLRKAGKNFQGLCPFHNEKTPSFSVSPEKQFFHCFGCGANGTAIGFLMDFSNLGFVEAVEELARRAGLEVPREGGGTSRNDGDLTELHELLELVADFYRRQLREHPQCARAVDYLKSRGITGEVAARFEIGYAPAGWDNLIEILGKSDAAKQRLLRAGMILNRDGGGHYDRFRDRVMFPIRDHRGRAIGFGGRVIDDETPKYLNSPETPVFHKGRELYGLHLCRGAEQPRLFVVEGYMDVVALAQFGVSGVVATLGTAATRDHMERLFRTTSRIIFCFDGDEAGQRAGWRALETALPLLRDGRQVFFLFLPEGEDPDTFVRRHGREAFEDEQLLVPLSDHLLNTLRAGIDLETREGRAQLVDKVVPLVGRMPRGALRQLLLEDLAGYARTDPARLDPLVTDAPAAMPARPGKPRAMVRPRPSPGGQNPVSRLIAYLLYQPQLADLVVETGEVLECGVPGTEFLAELLDFLHSRPGINCAAILENWRGSRYEDRLRELAATESQQHLDALDLEVEFMDALDWLRKSKRKREVRELTKVTSMSELSEADRARLRNLGGRPESE